MACAWLAVAAAALVPATAAPAGTAAASQPAGEDGTAVAGLWLTEGGKGRVEIYPAPERPGFFEGRIVSGKDGPDAPRDTRNPDPELRDRPVKGIVFMTGFRHVGAGHYENGRIYDPQSGNTYRGKLRLESPDRLVLRGYLGISLFGASQTWTRLPPADGD
jgi:uncharacterized protein (DUF2147 family)